MKCPSCGIENLEDSKFCRKCATPFPEGEAFFTRTLGKGPSELASGTVIAGHYKINKILGRGGMGVVYLADDTRLKRSVALKFLPPGLALDEDIRRRFMIEAQAAAALSHPNICTIYEVDDQAEKAFISMEYVEGESLREKVAEGPLPFDHVLDIALQVCAGMDEAHKKGIVHRDIKSANIMLTAKGQAKIMDFGLAKVAGTAMVTKEGSTLGTVAYMSPEQAKGEAVDARTDIWSLGVVLFELASGKLPFRGDLESAVIHNIIHEEPKPLKAIMPKVPEEFERIVKRALKKKVDDRYGSAAEMLADLRKLHAGLEKEKAGVINLRSFLRIIRKPLVAIPTALILIAMGFLIYSTLTHQAKVRWAKNERLPEITQIAENSSLGLDYLKIYQLAVEAEKFIPHDPKLTEIFKKYSTRLSITTDPPGAKVFIKGYHTPDKEWEYLGVSPIENLRTPLEYLRFKIDKEGYEPVVGASASFDYEWKTNKVIPGKILRTLDKIGDIHAGMVRIAGLENKDIGKIDNFFMDRCEVTNKQYKGFMEKGGYQKKDFWKNKFIKDGKELTWDQAMAEFVDSTGRPGPATWQGGDYPEGQDDYPVSGVSWYEAAAYAEFAGRSLPTGTHWERARGGGTWLIDGKGFSEFFAPQSNFKGKGPDRVGGNPAITAYGLFDMGGNVREWCWNETQHGRLIRGGAWDDVPYMFDNWSQVPPFDRSAKNGFRCALYVHPERIPQSALAKVEVSGYPDFYKQKPVPDSVFRVYKDQFSYDKRDLNARVEWRNETSKEWIQEKVSFDAAYENERVFGYLFLPRNSSPPFQTVIYFPGSTSAYARSSKDMDKWREFLPFIVKNGRAFLYPVYKGTFERGNDALTDIHTGDNSHQYTEFFIKVVKDFRKSIDYLETRSDIDCKKLAYLGVSWGGIYGAIIPAVEDRLKASVLRVGGMGSGARPEVNEINYVSRVKIPTLMLNGRYDMTFPYEVAVKPMFDLLGTPPDQKELKLYDTDHFIPYTEFIKETLRWLDKYLGPVNKQDKK